uniref:Retrotransposon gag domain-containing protein n=1 Tax=Latimeria chalumnae TaxID=7897 RepID=H3APZ4_LATCH
YGVRMDQLPPPSALNLQGNLAESWQRFKQEFEIFLIASGIAEKAEKMQAMTFLHVAGPAALDVYNMFEWEGEEDKEDLSQIMDKFKRYCNPRKNVTYKRHLFNTQNQSQSESIDAYVTDLKLQTKSCEFGELCDSLICDRTVYIIQNDQVRHRLLREADLALARAIDICRTTEVSKTQLKSLSEPAPEERLAYTA